MSQQGGEESDREGPKTLNQSREKMRMRNTEEKRERKKSKRDKNMNNQWRERVMEKSGTGRNWG